MNTLPPLPHLQFLTKKENGLLVKNLEMFAEFSISKFPQIYNLKKNSNFHLSTGVYILQNTNFISHTLTEGTNFLP